MEKIKNMEIYIEYLVTWLQEEQTYRGTDNFVFGISGGIDSAVIAFLLAKAYPENSLGIFMPCMSHPKDTVDAKLIMNKCGLPLHTVDLTKTHTQLMTAITPSFSTLEDNDKNRVIAGNMSARLRMTTLYTVAQARNAIVVGTDNAVEWHMGYFTKFGDGGVDIVPLYHLDKDEVYQMAHVLGVPEAIIQKEPSAGLWEAQTDEKEMGITYASLNHYLNGGKVSEKENEVIQYWHQRSHHKREMPRVPKSMSINDIIED